MRKPLSAFRTLLLHIFFPPVCILCGEGIAYAGTPICSRCWEKASPICGSVCSWCGLPFMHMDRGGSQGLPCLCQQCMQRGWNFERARSGFIFDGPVRDAIHILKYKGNRGLGAWLGRRMAEVLTHLLNGDREECVETLIVPVPLSAERLREREFNQSLILAQSIGEVLRLSVCPSLLYRKGHSRPQVGLRPEERWANVRGVFGVKATERAMGKRIILVDDVFTTGATANECGRMLKRAGASRVEVWTLARAL